MNKIGFNLLPWSAGVSSAVFPLLDRLKSIGYDGIELLIGSPDETEYKALGNYARELNLETTGVFVLGADDNPIASESVIRQRGLDKIKWAIDRAHDLGSKVICGPFHSAHGSFSRAAPTEEEYQWSAEVLQQAGEYAKQADIVLALEAVNRFETYLANTMEQLAKLVELTNHSHVRAMYDTHHANIEEKSIKQPIDRIRPYLAHVHISENDRGTPGKGLVHWQEVFTALKAANYEGWYTIESFSRADPDFANAINVWREYSDPWEIAEEGYTFIKSMLAKA
ncbi:TIM barrel protein [Sphingobacterium sp. DK4209]|uniref:TIM barrel protein n=1 Tax=Sphingobacterium zhuxiongii TaxID=2662364 RepID=A0A5Q0QD25_9SPHI|nr:MULTISPECIES: sugar phosphate isomerase/epimerase family protein [unclassified Sphingobacterium]MVZ66629.1 TIM barrel protein [Sphingobacterium sp. DK4209]QGA26811.1 TIM barrel protein [Sphingobacterium sp. dk4302]